MARILVVDDEAVSREILREMLEGFGHEVTEADTSEAGIRLFEQDPSDLVVTDPFVPVEGGLGVIRRLRTNFPNVRIIAISDAKVQENAGILARAREVGALRTFEKPVDPDALREAVEELLGKGA